MNIGGTETLMPASPEVLEHKEKNSQDDKLNREGNYPVFSTK